MFANGLRAKFTRIALYRLLNLSVILLIISTFYGCSSTKNMSQLAMPQVNAARIIYKDTATFSLDFRMQGADIRYTTDGEAPTKTSTKYNGTITVKQPIVIKAKAFCRGFLPSETLQLESIQQGARIDSIYTVPKAPYTAQLGKTLHNNQFGDSNLHQHWLGFQDSVTVICLYFDKPTYLQTVEISVLQNQGSWIFLPYSYEVFDETGNNVGEIDLIGGQEDSPNESPIFHIGVEKKPYKSLCIKLETMQAIPDWHPAKGEKPWLFIDEIIVR